jgi:signal transduction histidine kinase
MRYSLTVKNTLLILLIYALSFSAKAQTEFSDDSLQIIKNADELLKKPLVKSLDSVKLFLNKDLKNPNVVSEDLANFYMARYFYMTQQVTLASSVINSSIEDNFNNNYSDAKFYNIQGAIYSLKKQYRDAINSFLHAANLYQQQGNVNREHVIYNNVANIYLALGDLSRAYEFSSRCFAEFRNHPEMANYVSVLGVLAICESNLDMLDSSNVHIEMGLRILDTSSNVVGEILINYAKAELEFKKNNYYNAIPYARKSLTQSSKYNLTEYEVISSIILMKIHNKLKEFDLALSYGESGLEYASHSNNLSLRHSISDGIATAYAGIGDFEKAYIYKNKSDSLKTIDRDEQTKRSIDSLLVQFETLTSKNKILGQEIIIANQSNVLERKNNTLIISVFTLIILILFIIGLFVYNRQRLVLIRNKQEVDLINAVSASEEEERNKLSSLLHDGLAAELTALKLELEQNTNVSQTSFVILHKAHSLTRRISHNLSPYMINEKGLIEAVAYLVSNNNVNKNLYFYSNITEDLNIKPKVAIILFRSTQELLQNAIKHANAHEIVVQLMLKDNVLRISVEDDGIGMDVSVIDDSVGLGSLKKRIEVINGELNFDSSPSHGTSVFINFKLGK